MDYLDWLLKQRKGGPVPLTDIDLNREDLTIVDVPSSCMGFITGRKGLHFFFFCTFFELSSGESLRNIEHRTTTFCFGDGDKDESKNDYEKLYIFSHLKSGRKYDIFTMKQISLILNLGKLRSLCAT